MLRKDKSELLTLELRVLVDDDWLDDADCVCRCSCCSCCSGPCCCRRAARGALYDGAGVVLADARAARQPGRGCMVADVPDSGTGRVMPGFG